MQTVEKLKKVFETPFRDKKKRGCPTCNGIDPRSCMRCYGKTRMCDWIYTNRGYAHVPIIGHLGKSIIKEIK